MKSQDLIENKKWPVDPVSLQRDDGSTLSNDELNAWLKTLTQKDFDEWADEYENARNSQSSQGFEYSSGTKLNSDELKQRAKDLGWDLDKDIEFDDPEPSASGVRPSFKHTPHSSLLDPNWSQTSGGLDMRDPEAIRRSHEARKQTQDYQSKSEFEKAGWDAITAKQISDAERYQSTIRNSGQGNTMSKQDISEAAKSRKQQKFMGMVYKAKKGGKPASPAVAKAAKGMSTKSAKDFASTKHKGLPEKKKKKVKEAIETISAITEMLAEAKGKIKGVDGKACWKGKRYAGKVKKADGTYKDKCIPVGEGIADDAFADLDAEIERSRRPQSVKDRDAAAARASAPLRSDPNSINQFDRELLKPVDNDPPGATYMVNGVIMNRDQYKKFQQDYGNKQQDPTVMDLERGMEKFKLRNRVKEGGKEGDKYIIKSGPNKGKRWSPDTPGPTNPNYKEIDGNIPSPPDGATAPPPGWKPERSKSAPAPRSNKRADAGETNDVAVAEGKKRKKDLTGDGKNNFDDVQAARRIASGQDKKTAVKAAKSDKLSETKKEDDDLPFTPDEKTSDKDQYGNVIKNKARHLARKGRAAAEQEAKKKKEKVSEGWDRDELAAKLFETSEDHHDHEATMAKAQLMRIAEQSIELFKMIQEGDNLEGWVAAKITKANDYINAVHQNLAYDEVTDQEKTISSDDDYMAELRSILERKINS